MGKITGFMEFERIEEGYKPVTERLKNYKEFVIGLDDKQAKEQSARCMDCGTPFCNNGCPVNNIIPDFNDLVYQGDWKTAIDVLHSTNNFPEFTGRICPAPCEAACTLNYNDDAVGIKSIEHAIIDRAWSEGWVTPQPSQYKTGKKVAVVGSGPAGMAAAQQLARHAAHEIQIEPARRVRRRAHAHDGQFGVRDRVGAALRGAQPAVGLRGLEQLVQTRLDDRRNAVVEVRHLRRMHVHADDVALGGGDTGRDGAQRTGAVGEQDSDDDVVGFIRHGGHRRGRSVTGA